MVSANQTPNVVTITTPGPQGPQGPAGPPGGATTGSNTFTGNQTITGSILISGSIIPAVEVGQTTSSFSLGSETAAWKDIYVSEGSIKFIKSGSTTVTLSAANGGISVDGGSVISADGVSGQFITSKSLDTNITVKDSNNSLLMGPIDIETDKEIVVEEGSDLTIFGDVDIQNVATADTALFSTSASFSDSSSYAVSSSYSDTASYTTSASFAVTASYTPSASFANTSSYAVTASYALNATSTSTFPYSGSAIITGSLVVNNGTSNIINTSDYQLLDSNGRASIDWENKTLKNSNTISADWSNRLLQDSSEIQSVDWENRTLNNSNGDSVINYSNSSSLSLTSGGSTFDINKYSTFTNDGSGVLSINGGQQLNLSGSVIALQSPQGYYTLISASSTITSSVPTQTGGNMTLAFTQVGSNYYINVYIGGQWRSASLF
jgi:hypothetical protein